MKKRSKKRWLRKYDGKKYGWFLQIRDFALLLLGLFIAFDVFVGVSRVSGRSMDPTLRDGQDVFFTRISFSYSRGQVVFARMPSGSNYVKRIVAVPGDTVDIRDGILYVNGQPEQRLHHIGDTLPQEGIVGSMECPETLETPTNTLNSRIRPISIRAKSRAWRNQPYFLPSYFRSHRFLDRFFTAPLLPISLLLL